jgi:hypothetical protein
MQDIKKESNEEGEFDNIDFTKLDFGQIISLCLRCNTKEDAEKVLRQYEKNFETPEIARSNLGYIFGYTDDENRKKLYSLFPVNHPIFGEDFGRGKDPSPEEAFRIGKNIGVNVKNVER